MKAAPGRLGLALGLALAGGCAHGAAATRQAPPDPLASVSARELYERGVSLSQAGDYVRAEQYLAAAQDRGHDRAAVLPHLIDACLGATRYQAALRHAIEHLTENPHDWALRYLVASLLSATGDPARARLELEQVIADRPDAAGPHYLMAVILGADPAEIAAAAAEFEAYLALEPRGQHAAEAAAWLRRTGGARP